MKNVNAEMVAEVTEERTAKPSFQTKIPKGYVKIVSATLPDEIKRRAMQNFAFNRAKTRMFTVHCVSEEDVYLSRFSLSPYQGTDGAYVYQAEYMDCVSMNKFLGRNPGHIENIEVTESGGNTEIWTVVVSPDQQLNPTGNTYGNWILRGNYVGSGNTATLDKVYFIKNLKYLKNGALMRTEGAFDITRIHIGIDESSDEDNMTRLLGIEVSTKLKTPVAGYPTYRTFYFAYNLHNIKVEMGKTAADTDGNVIVSAKNLTSAYEYCAYTDTLNPCEYNPFSGESNGIAGLKQNIAIDGNHIYLIGCPRPLSSTLPEEQREDYKWPAEIMRFNLNTLSSKNIPFAEADVDIVMPLYFQKTDDGMQREDYPIDVRKYPHEIEGVKKYPFVNADGTITDRVFFCYNAHPVIAGQRYMLEDAIYYYQAIKTVGTGIVDSVRANSFDGNGELEGLDLLAQLDFTTES